MGKVKPLQIIIKALVLYMPFHTFIFNLLKIDGIIVLGRDIIAILLFSYAVFFIRHGKLKIDAVSSILIASWLFGLVHAFLFHDKSMSASIWLNTYRVYFFPSLIYFVIINANLSQNEAHRIKLLYIYEAFGVCLFGIIQQLFIGRAFTDYMGYRRESIRFATGIQRNIGFFDSANIMAVYLMFALILCLEEIKAGRKKSLKFIISVLFAGFLLTFSFSSYIALIAVLIARLLINSKNASILVSKAIKGLIAMCSICIIAFLIDKVLIDSLIFNQITNKFIDLYAALTTDDLYSLTTSSAADHLLSLIEPIKTVKENPLGVGFSVGTFMVLGKVDRLQYAVESSIFTILFDFGVISGIIYLIPFCSVFFLKKTKSKAFTTQKLLGIALLTTFISLPLVQAYELRFFFFMFYGLSQIDYCCSEVLEVHR